LINILIKELGYAICSGSTAFPGRQYPERWKEVDRKISVFTRASIKGIAVWKTRLNRDLPELKLPRPTARQKE
jgi:hypothetical protein